MRGNYERALVNFRFDLFLGLGRTRTKYATTTIATAERRVRLGCSSSDCIATKTSATNSSTVYCGFWDWSSSAVTNAEGSTSGSAHDQTQLPSAITSTTSEQSTIGGGD